jgi:hypothetical protein
MRIVTLIGETKRTKKRSPEDFSGGRSYSTGIRNEPTVGL